MNPLLAIGATAALMSERSRKVLRRGIVYGLAGAITAVDTATAVAEEVVHSAEHVASSAGGFAGNLVGDSRASHAATENGGEPKQARPAGSSPRRPAAARKPASAKKAGGTR
jgi:hypothetical protein